MVPEVPLNLKTRKAILPHSLTMAAVGLLESPSDRFDRGCMTDTGSNKNREYVDQGLANFVTSFLGAIGGRAMIGQSAINVTDGARTRLFDFFAGAFLLFLICRSGRSSQSNPHGGAGPP